MNGIDELARCKIMAGLRQQFGDTDAHPWTLYDERGRALMGSWHPAPAAPHKSFTLLDSFWAYGRPPYL